MMFKFLEDMKKRKGRNDRKTNSNKYNKSTIIVEEGREVLPSGAIQTNNWVKVNTPKNK